MALKKQCLVLEGITCYMKQCLVLGTIICHHEAMFGTWRNYMLDEAMFDT